MTRTEFVDFFGPIWSMRFDLEDGLLQELREWKNEYQEAKESGETDFTWIAEAINESLESYGYPTFPIEYETES